MSVRVQFLLEAVLGQLSPFLSNRKLELLKTDMLFGFLLLGPERTSHFILYIMFSTEGIN